MKARALAVLAGSALSLSLLAATAVAGCGGCPYSKSASAGDPGCTSRHASAASASVTLPQAGERAPDFRLPSTSGKPISLADYRGKKTVVLYFYPKDETPGCTKEACDFRDHSAELEQAGVVILGVSNDDLKSHADFRQKEHIPFPLLADTDARVSKMYGVYGAHDKNGHKWTGISRTTFVISKSGRIQQVWPNVNVDGHVEDVLSFVSQTQQAGT